MSSVIKSFFGLNTARQASQNTEDFDGDRWCGTWAVDAAHKQEKLAGPQQVEGEVRSITATRQSDVVLGYSHTSVTGRDRC